MLHAWERSVFFDAQVNDIYTSVCREHLFHTVFVCVCVHIGNIAGDRHTHTHRCTYIKLERRHKTRNIKYKFFSTYNIYIPLSYHEWKLDGIYHVSACVRMYIYLNYLSVFRHICA